MDYPGKVITKTQVTPTQTSASGNWTLDDQAAAIKNNNWPVALVPNPISKSLRFNSADSAYLNRTPASAGSRTTWTWSSWVKRAALGTSQYILQARISDNANDTDKVTFRFTVNNTLILQSQVTTFRETTAVYRDISAWYHVVLTADTSNATANNRFRIYVNGVEQVFSTTTNPTSGLTTAVNSANTHWIGSEQGVASYLSSYLTEINFIDGQALTPSSFGMTNPQTGQWIPLKYSGTYGTNGFYLNFKDATSTTTLGYDYSGNANNWTTNNFSVTAGVGNDSLTDVPTPWFAYNTTGDVGGVIRGNYCTWNPLKNSTTLSDGNLRSFNSSTTQWLGVVGTFGMTSGKWYWEYTPTVAATVIVGLANSSYSTGGHPGSDANSWGYYSANGNKYFNNSGSAYGATYTANDVIGVAFDADAGTLTFYKNGISQGTAYSSLTSGPYFPAVGVLNSQILFINAGQRPFAYTPPTGFRSLCTTNLPATAIGFGLTNQANKYMNVVLYTGDGTANRSVTGVGFQPDLVWAKARSAAYYNGLFDNLRSGRALYSNATDAEDTTEVVAFGSDGFTTPNKTSDFINTNSATYVAWNWKAGGTGVSNTAGTITSTVSANTTAGFSIVTYTGNGTNGATVGHGLGVAPSMIIIKVRNAADNWPVYHRSLGNTDAVFLNTTAATQALTYWNSTTPSSTVFTLGSNLIVNKSSDTFVAYCFAAVPGYSAFGSYTGNGSSDGPFIFTNFRSRFLLTKRTDTTSNWIIYDSARDTYNAEVLRLFPDLSNAEQNAGGIDFLSNGFKLRDNGPSQNASGGTYIYMAFAESPFQFSNAR